MNRLGTIFKASLAVGVIAFVLEVAGYLLFTEAYGPFFSGPEGIGAGMLFGIKLLGACLVTAFFITVFFDFSYDSLPGGFLRKSINFSFIIWALQVLPVSLRLLIAGSIKGEFFMLVAAQHYLISLILALVLSGIYIERKRKADEALQAKEEKAKGGESHEKSDITL
ncbi:MAG TPA: hypothetical protein ENN43_09105 [bacterium]|nr:hypothetical protein [bacterium]